MLVRQGVDVLGDDADEVPDEIKPISITPDNLMEAFWHFHGDPEKREIGEVDVFQSKMTEMAYSLQAYRERAQGRPFPHPLHEPPTQQSEAS